MPIQTNKPHNIAIVWDFDGTLTPQDSTTIVVEHLNDKEGDFWKYIKSLRGDTKQPEWKHVLASDAPIWMYSLSRLAFKKKVPLNAEFFSKFIVSHINLYPKVIEFMRELKNLEKDNKFKKLDIEIHHFIVSAGLKELVEQVFPDGLVRWTFGCRYVVTAHSADETTPENVPVFCMDETMKTRSLFEISKGSFSEEHKSVNTRIEKDDLWSPFGNIIYVGDGDTDIPALSLVRSKGGLGVVVYNPEKPEAEINEKLRAMRKNKRADFITAADFSLEGDLFNYISTRCQQIMRRYEAEVVW